MTLSICPSIHFSSLFYYRSTIGVLKIPIVIVSVGFKIPIVTDSDSIGHPWNIDKFVIELFCTVLLGNIFIRGVLMSKDASKIVSNVAKRMLIYLNEKLDYLC